VPHGVVLETFDIPHSTVHAWELVDNAVAKPSLQSLAVSIGPNRDMPIRNPARATMCGGYAVNARCVRPTSEWSCIESSEVARLHQRCAKDRVCPGYTPTTIDLGDWAIQVTRAALATGQTAPKTKVRCTFAANKGHQCKPAYHSLSVRTIGQCPLHTMESRRYVLC
jgi:hypothetical protein